MRLLFILAVLGSISRSATAEPVRTISSGTRRALVLELYTSEGCSSCPPAERWMHANAATLAAWRVVPLAFHVDYWNEIGWVDPFSSPRWSERQRRLAAAGNGQVYTPELVLSGREVRHAELERSATRLGAERAPELRLSVRAGAAELVLSAIVAGAPAGAHLYYAVYESGLEVDVRSGENAGQKLQHDFVVRGLVGPVALDAAQKLALPSAWRRDRLGVAAFLEAPGSTDILQAVALQLVAP